MNSATLLLHSLLVRFPLLLLVLAGVIFAIVRWKRHPLVSLLTILGLCFWQIESFAFLFVRHKLPGWLGEFWSSPDALIMLITAAFIRRGARPITGHRTNQ